MISAKWVFLILALGVGVVGIPGITGMVVFALTWAVIDLKHAIAVFLISNVWWFYIGAVASWQFGISMTHQAEQVQQATVQATVKARSECDSCSESSIVQKVQSDPQVKQATQQFDSKVSQVWQQEQFSLAVVGFLFAYSVRMVIKKKNEIRKRIQPLHAYQLIRRRRV